MAIPIFYTLLESFSRFGLLQRSILRNMSVGLDWGSYHVLIVKKNQNHCDISFFFNNYYFFFF